MFVEYENHEQALDAIKMFDGFKLDKQHIFAVNLFNAIDKYLSMPDEVEEPTPQPYIDRGNLRSWLLDPDCYDQYSVLHEAGEKTSIFLNSMPEPAIVKERMNWTEQTVQWSPLGKIKYEIMKLIK